MSVRYDVSHLTACRHTVRRWPSIVSAAVPSQLHEGMIELFRQRPSLAAKLLAGPFGFDVPGYQQIRLDANELTDVKPTEYRADSVITLDNGDGAVLSVVVEVQLNRDDGKRRSWPVYLTTLHARHGCPAVLLVVCANAAVASWCAEPIPLGHPDFVLRPLVAGPQRVPVVTDPQVATECPELVVLSTIAHAGDPDPDRVFPALLRAFGSVDEENGKLYLDLVGAALPKAARQRLEAMMTTGTYEYQTEFVRRLDEREKRRVAEGVARGEARGEAQALLMFLEARGVPVPEDVRARVVECTDREQLNTWVRRAATATCIHDVFDTSD